MMLFAQDIVNDTSKAELLTADADRLEEMKAKVWELCEPGTTDLKLCTINDLTTCTAYLP